MTGAASVLARCVETATGTQLPVAIKAWDGSTAGPVDGPAFVLRSPQALRRMLWRPGQLGLARAWVAGEFDVDGDLYEALDRISRLLWDREGAEKADGDDGAARGLSAFLRGPSGVRALFETVALARPGLPPAPPAEEVGGRRGRAHTLRSDRAAISHHYDVGNDFYRLVLGPSLVYSCAYWQGRPDDGATLEEAQEAKLELICRKLDLRAGERLLDVGCGWGSLALHAARRHGVRVVGVTISGEQAVLARERVERAGLADQVEIRVQDYREIPDGPYDAISSVGMAEHVGTRAFRGYAEILHGLLKPEGRLLNHQIARRPVRDEKSYRMNSFIDRYVFPDGELALVGSTAALLEEAGFEVRDVEALREHYALTLREWVTNLERNWDEAVRLTSPERARVWRLYMAASALGFERNTMGVNQVLAVRTAQDGSSGMPLLRGVGRWAEPALPDDRRTESSALVSEATSS
ncbi:cyclopropane-fatty-acyl-phospholipid synthase family protein [Streptomyces sp. NBC_00878]|uniref:SAM-dependent methyltransferase n=1 Tax=Streptomyces sp. NBC_00878 TaxID=2975854 RepID=UPI002250E4E6|nr:cyclopropane-fatty-acyl-phospholipid synthase family protein [Streptomyces sp. NBC_00878]MCX4904390.1 cyclopropane-fatty-acyl-phospholipid synthase family protein [Streptomyces sp. NBC_00878]